MSWTTEIFGGNIVVLGDFNPAVFSPQWLELNKLIGAEDAKAATEAKDLVVSSRATQVVTEAFTLQVTPDQMIVQSTLVLSPIIRDIAVGALMLLSHTPVRALGMNYMAHFKLASVNDRHHIGDVFAPKDIWYKLFDPEIYSAGVANLQIKVEVGKRGETPQTKDFKNITMQPSSQVPNGVYFQLNDHRTVGGDESKTSAEAAAITIQTHWQDGWDEAVRVFDGALSAAMDTAK